MGPFMHDTPDWGLSPACLTCALLLSNMACRSPSCCSLTCAATRVVACQLASRLLLHQQYACCLHAPH